MLTALLSRRVWLIGLLAVLAGAPGARAQAPKDDFWILPDHAVAWWALDPQAMGLQGRDPGRVLVETGLRALLDRAAVVQPAGLSLANLVSPAALGDSPYRLVLLDLDADSVGRPGPDMALRPQRLAAILEVRHPRDGVALVQSVRGSLPPDAAVEPLDLPGGLKGSSAPGAEPALDVSWCDTPEFVLIGRGRDALTRWLTAQAAGAGEADAMRGDTAKNKGDAGRCFEAGADLNALRRAIPEQFAYGRIGRLLDAWRIANDRQVLMTGWSMPAPADRTPRLLAVDLGFSSRAEHPGLVHTISITQSEWPAGVTAEPAPYAAVFESDWRRWIGMSLATWVACSERDGAEVNAMIVKWMKLHRGSLDRLAGVKGEYTVVRGGVDGLAVEAQLAAEAKPVRLAADARDVFKALGPAVGFDERSGVWSLTLAEDQADPDHLLRRFFWGITTDHSAMLGGWIAGPVEARCKPTAPNAPRPRKP